MSERTAYAMRIKGFAALGTDGLLMQSDFLSPVPSCRQHRHGFISHDGVGFCRLSPPSEGQHQHCSGIDVRKRLTKTANTSAPDYSSLSLISKSSCSLLTRFNVSF